MKCSKGDNFALSWPTHVASALQAELHVQAISGLGVTANADGSKSRTMLDLLDRTLHSVDRADYDGTSWVPSLVAFYIGSNDFVSFWSSPWEADFKKGYRSMVERILAPFGGTPPPVVHVCREGTTSCQYIKDLANEAGHIFTGTTWDIPAGCLFHRDAAQHKALAEKLTPVFESAVSR
jgi:hypothetical protein